MPFKDREKNRDYKRRWKAQRRAEAVAGKVCAKCGAAGPLELDHIEPMKKVSHDIWSWSEPRRAIELAKCQWLCIPCHKIKTADDRRSAIKHGSATLYRAGCRCTVCVEAYRARKREDYRRYGC